MIIKAEVVRHPGREPKMNPRFVVTNLRGNPYRLYERVYCARAIKELHHGLEIDRTSCPRFLANQFSGASDRRGLHVDARAAALLEHGARRMLEWPNTERAQMGESRQIGERRGRTSQLCLTGYRGGSAHLRGTALSGS
jgi:Transposase DDE domain group 1